MASSRDDFPAAVKETLAKRVALRCSNPTCRKPTGGPQDDPAKAINLGVAAHIHAAAAGGARFDPCMSPDDRKAPSNAIWLCQNCAKMVDNDPTFYTTDILSAWKALAEATARRDLEQQRPVIEPAFARLERLMPALLNEMARDLAANPLKREFILFKRVWSYTGRDGALAYYYDEHPDLDDKTDILENVGAVKRITKGDHRGAVDRYRFTEAFVDYLTSRT